MFVLIEVFSKKYHAVAAPIVVTGQCRMCFTYHHRRQTQNLPFAYSHYNNLAIAAMLVTVGGARGKSLQRTT